MASGESDKVNQEMQKLQSAGHALSIVLPRAEKRALGVTAALGQGGALYARVIAPPGKAAL